MIIDLVVILLCFTVLTWSADIFVDASIAIADHFHVPKIVIGTILVGATTAFPELLVSFDASVHGARGIAIGNALGSYVINIALVLGVTACIQPIKISSALLKKELPVMSGVVLLVCVMLSTGYLGVLFGFVLIAFFTCLALSLMCYLKRHFSDREAKKIMRVEVKYSPSKASLYALLSLCFMLLSARFLTTSAVAVASYLGVHDLMIGLTIVAVGTSLPELAASIAGVKKGEDDIAIGNVIGSNILGLLAVLAMPALFAPGPVSQVVLLRDGGFMLAATILLWIACLFFDHGKLIINRKEGVIGVALYIIYVIVIMRFPVA